MTNFASLEKEFFYGWLKRNPILGTNLGLHQYDTQLPAGDVDKIEDDIRFLTTMRTKFETVRPERLGADSRIDRELALYLIDQWLFERDELRRWQSMPESPRFIGEAIYQLLVRNYAPLGKRLQSILERLEKLPRYIRQSISQLKNPTKQLIEIELETITRLPGFFFALKELSRENVRASDFRRISRAMDKIQEALDDFCESMIIDVLSEAKDTYEMSRAQFKKFLKVNLIDESPEQLISFANRRFDSLEERLKELSSKIKKRTNIEEVRDIIKSKHPTDFHGAMDFVRGTIKKAKEFIRHNQFSALPQGENIYLVDTPQYLRHFYPIGSYWAAPKFEKNQEGFYFLTPPTVDESKLREQNFATLTTTTLHDLYPGLHTLRVASNANKSLMRSLSWPADTTLGWSAYCEEKMLELGFAESPEVEFMKVVNQLWRCAKVIIDVKLSTGTMSQKEAVAFLVENTGLDWSSAEAEVRRYLTAPVSNLCHLIAYEKMIELKKHAKEKAKEKYTDKFFHNFVLSSGNLPIRLLRKELDNKVSALKTSPDVKNKKNKAYSKT